MQENGRQPEKWTVIKLTIKNVKTNGSDYVKIKNSTTFKASINILLHVALGFLSLLIIS